MKIEIRNVDLVASELRQLTKDIRNSIENGLDKNLDNDVETLKGTLLDYVNYGITEKVPDPTKESESLRIPKSKVELVKEIFNVDITNSDAMKSLTKGITLNDNSNILILKDGRIKALQNVSDSSDYYSQETYFKNRVMNGIIYDSNSGKLYKIPENSVKGIKLECSSDTGQTLNSEKKFNAYKQSSKITRRKGDSPDQRVAVWTTKKNDLNFMMNNAIDLDKLIVDITESKYETAISKLQMQDTKGLYKNIIENIQNIKSGNVANPGTKTFVNLQNLVRNLKIRKKISEFRTTYTLFTTYSKDLNSSESGLLEESEDAFIHTLKQEIFAWKIENEPKWIDTIVKSINDLIKSYNKT